MEITGLTNLEYINTVIKKRPLDSHKGDFGKLLIVAGSEGMTGASVLCAKAAMKSGSGLVTVCIKKNFFSIIQISVPEVICMSYLKVKKDLEQYDAIAIGPGMGTNGTTKKILKAILKNYTKTLVIDADGLNTIAKYDLYREIKKAKCQIIITPHIGEAKRLLKCEMLEDIKPEQLANSLVNMIGGTVIIKGHETLVAVDDVHAYTNTTGNPGMSTAGSGDVLTGIITSLVGQGLKPSDAARAGVFIHGMAGDIASDRLGDFGMIAGDMIECIPFAIKKCLN